MGSCFGSSMPPGEKKIKGQSKLVSAGPRTKEERKKSEVNNELLQLFKKKSSENITTTDFNTKQNTTTDWNTKQDMDKRRVENLHESLAADHDVKIDSGNGPMESECHVIEPTLQEENKDVCEKKDMNESIENNPEENKDVCEKKDMNESIENNPEVKKMKTKIVAEMSDDELTLTQTELMERLHDPVLKKLVKKKNTDKKKTALDGVLTESMLKAGVSGKN